MRTTMRNASFAWTIRLLFGAVVASLLVPIAASAGWKAGVARATITPQEPLWMSGYAARDRPAEGALHDLWAKALALEDGQGRRAVLVTLDLCGIDRDLSQRICRRIIDAHGLDRSAIAISVSHTHSGPVVGSNLRAMYALDEKQNRLVDDYTKWLEDRIVAVAGEALTSTNPSTLQWTTGRATFAANRRVNKEEDITRLREGGLLKGPVDHDLPVLAVRPAAGGAPTALVFGYACHATTLSFYQWSGDWPGFAQIELEKSHPGATALFVAGCGADQNPMPRRTVQHAHDHGREAAAGVDAALKGVLRPVDGTLETLYSEVDLPFAAVPTREQLKADAESTDRYVARRAKHLLEQLARKGDVSAKYPYPVQVWRLGEGPRLVLLGGEVVVDYSLRLKRELGKKTWVIGYSNDVMAYIPSERVLAEGGYEGGGAMVYYGLPSPWAPGVEERIIKEVHQLVGATPPTLVP